MKLTSNLKLRPDFLYVAPLLNVVALLLIFFLLNSSLVVQSGMKVIPPVSKSSLGAQKNSHAITITAGTEPRLFFNKEEVTFADLPAKLREGKAASSSVVIVADELAAHGFVTRVQNAIWDAGCEAFIASRLAEQP